MSGQGSVRIRVSMLSKSPRPGHGPAPRRLHPFAWDLNRATGPWREPTSKAKKPPPRWQGSGVGGGAPAGPLPRHRRRRARGAGRGSHGGGARVAAPCARSRRGSEERAQQDLRLRGQGAASRGGPFGWRQCHGPAGPRVRSWPAPSRVRGAPGHPGRGCYDDRHPEDRAILSWVRGLAEDVLSRNGTCVPMPGVGLEVGPDLNSDPSFGCDASCFCSEPQSSRF